MRRNNGFDKSDQIPINNVRLCNSSSGVGRGGRGLAAIALASERERDVAEIAGSADVVAVVDVVVEEEDCATSAPFVSAAMEGIAGPIPATVLARCLLPSAALPIINAATGLSSCAW